MRLFTLTRRDLLDVPPGELAACATMTLLAVVAVAAVVESRQLPGEGARPVPSARPGHADVERPAAPSAVARR